MKRACLGVAAALSIAACGSEQTNEAAVNDSAAEASRSAAVNDPDNPFADAEREYQDRMMAATGVTPSETWVRKMIEHHQGAIDMANVLLSRGGEDAVIAAARRSIELHSREIATLRTLLEGGGATATTDAGAEPEPRSEARPAAKAAPRERPTEPPAPKAPPPEPDPHEGHDMGNMANMQQG